MAKKKPDLYDLDLVPNIGEGMDKLFGWLSQSGLTREGHSYQKSSKNHEQSSTNLYDEDFSTVIASPAQRSKRLTQKEIKAIKDNYQGTIKGLDSIGKDCLWQTIRSKYSSVRVLDFKRLPADAMAFYRPFHYPPFDQWGIYLMIEPLLDYHRSLKDIICKTGLFSPETMMHLILFEIFHHEFFHHIAESTATTIEIICAATGNPKRIYLEYKNRQHNGLIEYPHNPLEEALANAYAWNSLGFISRVKAGYKTAVVSFYQKAVEKHWAVEPPGYRDAAFYIKHDHIPGAAHFLAQLIGQPKVPDNLPLVKLAQSVMPNGFSAFLKKPDIPTWLVGSQESVEYFYELVPAPNEAYTQLFWPYDTGSIDKYIQQKISEESEKSDKLKMARKG